MDKNRHNLLDAKLYVEQLEQRKHENIANIERRLLEILDKNLTEGKESFYITSGAFKNNSEFILAEDILRKNGWHVQHLLGKIGGDSMYVSLHEIV